MEAQRLRACDEKAARIGKSELGFLHVLDERNAVSFLARRSWNIGVFIASTAAVNARPSGADPYAP